jgi:hypothetical protein
MEKIDQILDSLYDRVIEPTEAKEQLLLLFSVSVSLPTKDEVCAEGYRIANEAGYNYRRVLRDQDHDIYYSGWMDCYDFLHIKNK